MRIKNKQTFVKSTMARFRDSKEELEMSLALSQYLLQFFDELENSPKS